MMLEDARAGASMSLQPTLKGARNFRHGEAQKIRCARQLGRAID
jgi:hypothetical protein